MEKHIFIKDFEEKESSNIKFGLIKKDDKLWYLTDFVMDENNKFRKAGDIIDVYKQYIVFTYDCYTYLVDYENKKLLYKTYCLSSISFRGNLAILDEFDKYKILNLASEEIIESDIDYLKYSNSPHEYIFAFKRKEEDYGDWFVFNNITGEKKSWENVFKLNIDNFQVQNNYTLETYDTYHKITSLKDFTWNYFPTETQLLFYDSKYVLLNTEEITIRDSFNSDRKDIHLKNIFPGAKNQCVAGIKGKYAFTINNYNSKDNTNFNSHDFFVYDLDSEQLIYKDVGMIEICDNYLLISNNRKVRVLDLSSGIFDPEKIKEIKFTKKISLPKIENGILFVYYGGAFFKCYSLYDMKELCNEVNIKTVDYTITKEKVYLCLKSYYGELNYQYINLTNHKQVSSLKGDCELKGTGSLITDDGMLLDYFNDCITSALNNPNIDKIEILSTNTKRYYSTISVEGTNSLATYSTTVETTDKSKLDELKYNALLDMVSKITNRSDKNEVKTLIKK